MLFDNGSTLTFKFNFYKKIYLLKCCINSFVKRFTLPILRPQLIQGNPYLNKLESTLPENALTEVSFFMVYGFHPPLPLPWIMISTKLNSVYLNMFLHNCRHIRLNCFWKEKIYKDVFFIFLVKITLPHMTSHTPVTWFKLTYIYFT